MLSNNAGKSVTTFLKTSIFCIFCTPRDIITNGGSHLYNRDQPFEVMSDVSGVELGVVL